jgi:peptidoglycan/LPS O-acetylase OafA/YrhL
MTNNISQSSNPQFREATNLLRGICALAILVFHYQHFLYVGTGSTIFIRSNLPFYFIFSSFYDSGYLAVQVFWCISGLIMTHSYIRKKDNGAREYTVSRFARLYPLHIVTLLVVIVLQQISFQKFNTFQIYANNDLRHFLLNLFFVQTWGFEKGYSFNGPTWSVSIEIMIYILFFFVVSFLTRFRVFVPITVLIIYKLSANIELTSPFRNCLAYFFFGVVVYFCSTFATKKFFRSIILFILLFEVFVYSALRHLDLISLNPGGNGYIWSTAFLVFLVAQIDDSKLAPLLIKVRMLGDLSYSVFLWHVPIQITIKLVQAKYSIDNSIAYNKSFFIFFIALTYFVGYLSYRYIEQPAQRIIRKRFARTATI